MKAGRWPIIPRNPELLAGAQPTIDLAPMVGLPSAANYLGLAAPFQQCLRRVRALKDQVWPFPTLGKTRVSYLLLKMNDPSSRSNLSQSWCRSKDQIHGNRQKVNPCKCKVVACIRAASLSQCPL